MQYTGAAYKQKRLKGTDLNSFTHSLRLWLCGAGQWLESDLLACDCLSEKTLCAPFFFPLPFVLFVKSDTLCFTLSYLDFSGVFSTWSQCAHWWMISSLNEWKAWLKTLRRIWVRGCSGTLNSSPGGRPTMWVPLLWLFTLSWFLGQSYPEKQCIENFCLFPPFSLPVTGQWLVGRVYLPERPWTYHGEQ